MRKLNNISKLIILGWTVCIMAMFTACLDDDAHARKNVPIDLNEAFSLEVEDCGVLTAEKIEICLEAVLEDSRCPNCPNTGILCIWPGAIKVRLGITVDGVSMDPDGVELVSASNDAQNKEEIEIGDFTLRISGVEPCADPNKTIDEDDYVVSFVLSE